MTSIEVVELVLGLVQGMRNTNHYGPYVITLSAECSKLLDEKYFPQDVLSGLTLRERLKQIDGVQEVKEGLDAGTCSIAQINQE